MAAKPKKTEAAPKTETVATSTEATNEAAATTEATETEAPAPVRISLKEICAELGIAPTAARRKLRTKLEKGDDFRWDFAPEDVDGVKAILTAKPEKKEAPAGETAETAEEAEETAEA